MRIDGHNVAGLTERAPSRNAALGALCFALAAASCGASRGSAPAARCATPASASASVQTPAASSESGRVDVDRDDCAATTHGTLFARDGSLFFRVSPDGSSDAPDDDAERRAAESWRFGVTRLAPRGDRVVTRDGVAGGYFSTVLPIADGASTGVAVRSLLADGSSGDAPADELVTLSVDTVTPRRIYAPGGRLRLLGRLDARILLLVQEGNAWKIVAVDSRGSVVARSRVIGLSEAVTLSRAAEVGLPWAAPAGPRRMFLACENDRICAVEVQGETITARDTGMGVGAGLSIANGEVWVERGNQRCVALRRGEVPSGRGLREEPCPQDRLVGPEDALPVNGALVSGVQADAPRCQVRHEIRLPPLPEEPEDLPPQPATLVVSEVSLDEAGELAIELLVRGSRLSLGWAAVYSGASVSTMRRDVGIALPPGTVRMTPAHLEGRAVWRVRVQTAYPVHPSRQCSQGRWVLGASTGERGFESGDTAWVNRYQEFGYCE